MHRTRVGFPTTRSLVLKQRFSKVCACQPNARLRCASAIRNGIQDADRERRKAFVSDLLGRRSAKLARGLPDEPWLTPSRSPLSSWETASRGPTSPGRGRQGAVRRRAIYHSGVRQACAIRKISALGVTVASDLAPALGDKVAVELATGQRAAGKIAWTGRGELGVRFDDAIDVIALLNRKLVSQTPRAADHAAARGALPRAHQMRREFLAGDAAQYLGAAACSSKASELPAVGTYVSVFVEGLNIPAGEVVWKRGELAGIELFEELSWTSIIPWVRGDRAANGMPNRQLRADEAVEHLLAAGVLEVDLELVAFDRGDGAVAELAVEHALAEREVGRGPGCRG